MFPIIAKWAKPRIQFERTDITPSDIRHVLDEDCTNQKRNESAQPLYIAKVKYMHTYVIIESCRSIDRRYHCIQNKINRATSKYFGRCREFVIKSRDV